MYPFVLGIAVPAHPSATTPIHAADILPVILFFMAALVIPTLVFLLVCNKQRYLAVASSMAWLSRSYIQKLPDMLKVMADAELKSPWPGSWNPISIRLYQRRMARLLQNDFAQTRVLIRQHLGLWAFVELHRQDMQDLLLRHQVARLRDLFLATPESHLREHLLEKITQCRIQLAMVRKMAPAPALTEDSVPWLERLEAVNVLFQEQGYSIHPLLAQLEHWQSARNEDVLHEIEAEGSTTVTVMHEV